MSDEEQARQQRIDDSLARQLARSMKHNIHLNMRVRTLRKALETVNSLCDANPGPVSIVIGEVCKQTLKADERTKDDV
jgi:hypothetical protein